MAPPEGCFDREVGVASADIPKRTAGACTNIGIKVLALRGDYSKDAEAQQTAGGEDQA
jgi:hypothetical protein